jgi:FkbH-like protein
MLPENSTSPQFRERMNQATSQSDWPGLLAEIRQMVHSGARAADFVFAAARLKKMAEAGARAAGLRYLRTYIVRSVTVEPFLPYLAVHSALAGFYLETRVGSYGAFIDDLMNEAGGLCSWQPALTLLFTDVEDIAGGLHRACAAADEAAIATETQEAASRFSSMLEAFRNNSTSRLLAQGLFLPDLTAQGDVADANSPSSELAAVTTINQALAAACRKIGDAVYFDQDRIAARYGRAGWRDPRMFLSARIAVAAPHFEAYSRALAQSIRALYVPSRKVLCTDLDGTLWGGIVGEDGPDGIETGAAFPGNCYRVYQQYLKGLSERGILLTIASKNNEAEVQEAFRARAADLSVALSNFVSVKIGWGEKADSLRAMASELSLGLDSFVFVDDSPAECAAIARHLPEVLVVEVPQAEPWALVQKISALGAFDTLGVTEDDRNRTEEYRAQSKRAQLESSIGSREDFLKSLHIVCTIGDGMAALPRTVQLINKTNQFNLTTRRHSAADVGKLAGQDGGSVLTARVADCFGDNGVVGVAIYLLHGTNAYIDTFLLSCRVIGRGIETALLGYLAAGARRRGAERLFGEYVATSKNQVAADFYPRHGFVKAPEKPQHLVTGEGLLYECDLVSGIPEIPSWVVIGEETYVASV